MIQDLMLNLKILLINYDDKIARKCSSLFSNKENGLFHFLLILIEYSFHGVPWLAVAVIGYFLAVTDPNKLSTTGQNNLEKKFLFVLISLLVDIAIIGLMKFIFKRNRPNLLENTLTCKEVGPDRYSFPSGHASRAILMTNLIAFLFLAAEVESATVWTLFGTNNYPSFHSILVSTLLHLWSLSTCISRILLTKHYMTDVLTGVIIGYLTYYLVLILYFAN